ncbi:putative membrane protein [Corynebacterium variabile DSM 44702]|uniref:Putative membrane protein n=1 Tax=Corynebacterium variabile (strain DSM 44702 / CIP 107183 / JCM 12073 / NCIMB 30131) TaxID=858619 RepID=G0HAW1_CORVD|nr:putative sulfate exporter family transporter [Corynebacterium variabile]AEK35777.1 putative membrane protein [Corynebacterium variabile DSM 44702]
MSEFLDARWQDILFRSYQHTSLVVQAIILATVIALALAVLVTNYRPLAPVANALFAIGLTIPGLALLGLMIPLVGIDDHLRALLSSAVSICGVSAAIAAAGAVKAKKEHLAYTATLVIAFELPSISILPWLADLLGLSPAVAGVWIGGNIDTTAAVSAAGAPAGEDSLQIASIVKVTQNALIGVVAVALTAWFALRVERDESAPRIRAIDFWHRFPKFVLGFIAASVAVTVAAEFLSEADLDGVDSAVKGFRDYFLTLAFVSVGLEFEAKALREAGMKPVAVFAAATLFNIVLGLALATLLFSNFAV